MPFRMETTAPPLGTFSLPTTNLARLSEIDRFQQFGPSCPDEAKDPHDLALADGQADGLGEAGAADFTQFEDDTPRWFRVCRRSSRRRDRDRPSD